MSYWKHPTNRNIMRLEEWPDGELRFWAHQLDPNDPTTREVLARRGLEIDVGQMTPEYVRRFCGFGYDHGLKYLDARRRGDTFEAVVAIGFDFFRGVERPKYGDMRWKITVTQVDDQTLRIGGRLLAAVPLGNSLKSPTTTCNGTRRLSANQPTRAIVCSRRA